MTDTTLHDLCKGYAALLSRSKVGRLDVDTVLWNCALFVQ